MFNKTTIYQDYQGGRDIYWEYLDKETVYLSPKTVKNLLKKGAKLIKTEEAQYFEKERQ